MLHGIFLTHENPCTEILYLCRVVILLSGSIFFDCPLFKLVYMERRGGGWICGVAGFHILMHMGLPTALIQFHQRHLLL